ncbi:acyltransferase family protein [Plantibacter sp. YIM 135347]|uniref:acyltransferase family protein n=1 Tax=Plantibacter sp. YIM 135347 TaxID=3423919 RepID=UPI003D32B007
MDGLRGLAAVIVLASHVMLTVPSLAAVLYTAGVATGLNAFETAIAYSPLHVFWAGQEAVVVFFVLSGLVLTLPVLKRPGFAWARYYPKRLVRLYVPVFAAVAFGVLLVVLVPRADPGGLGAWIENRPTSPSFTGIVRDLTLVAGPSRLISPLWSLQWEVIFSLLLPVYVWIATRWKAGVAIKVVLLLALVALGITLRVSALIYLPMFACGTLLAVHLETVRRVTARMRNHAWVWSGLLALALATSHWTLAPFISSRFLDYSVLLAFIGCAWLVIASMFADGFRRFLESRVLQWLGLISFSLYLTHEPIVIAITFLSGPGQAWLVALVGIPVALIIAWLFYLLVERPSHRLAQWVGNLGLWTMASPRSRHGHPARRGAAVGAPEAPTA